MQVFDVHDRLLLQLLLNGLREAQYEFFKHNFGKKQSLLSLFIHGLLTVEQYTNDTWFCLSQRCSDST